MKVVKRQEFLQALESVASGLARQDIVEQSTSFVFTNGQIVTFNEEIACRRTYDIGFEGAVKAAPLMEMVRKFNDEDIRIGADGSEFKVQTRTATAAIPLQAEILLPVGSVEQPTDWHPINPAFSESCAACSEGTSTVEDQFALTCVHLGPNVVESCDNYQATRFDLQTGLKQNALVRGKTMRLVSQLAVSEASEGENWLHFRNADQLMISCRRYLEDYPDLSGVFSTKGVPVSLPKGLGEAAARASIFTRDNSDDCKVSLHIKTDKVMVTGESLQGRYQQVLPIKYNGPEIKCTGSPALLASTVSKYTDFELGESRLVVRGGALTYVVSLNL